MLSNEFKQKAKELSEYIKTFSKELVSKPEAQLILKQPHITSLQKQGGFSAIHKRLQRNEIKLEDIITVLRHAKTNVLTVAQSLSRDQNYEKGGRHR